MNAIELHLFVGWVAMFLGVIAGAGMGLFFHHEKWAGGYGSFRRRMLRLGHISFFGIGFINIIFGLTLQSIEFTDTYVSIASTGFLLGVITMPLCCFLSAWKKPFRHLFPIPVLSVLAGIISILFGWPAP
jgi:hypothetical protein